MNPLYLSIFSILLTLSSYASTWDEPWQKQIIKESEYFVLGKVIVTSDSMIQVEIKKTFGAEVSDSIIVDDFFLLHLCSGSGHGPEFVFDLGQEGYLFLKKGENGNYQLPTPTSGFDKIVGEKMHATYRHTYHQAAMSVENYELTYTAIWNKFHGNAIPNGDVLKYINERLSLAPAGYEEHEIHIFFEQHAALETAYLLDLKLDFQVLKKFSSSDNFHSRISSIRAMYHLNNKKVKKYLLGYLKDPEKENFTKVIAIWSLWKMEDSKLRKRLWRMRKKLSDEVMGFGGNIMDTRICTDFPSPKSALIELKEKRETIESIKNK